MQFSRNSNKRKGSCNRKRKHKETNRIINGKIKNWRQGPNRLRYADVKCFQKRTWLTTIKKSKEDYAHGTFPSQRMYEDGRQSQTGQDPNFTFSAMNEQGTEQGKYRNSQWTGFNGVDRAISRDTMRRVAAREAADIGNIQRNKLTTSFSVLKNLRTPVQLMQAPL